MKPCMVLFTLIVALAPLPASAQLFADPLADAAGYLQARGAAPSNATHRLRYEVTSTEPNEARTISDVTLDVAPDWALVRSADATTLYDFRLNRVFLLSPAAFTTQNGLALLSFRVFERQNRMVLRRAMAAASPQAGEQMQSHCDADMELGVSIPSAETRVEFRERNSDVTFRCDDREVATFTWSAHRPPPAFWPVLFAELSLHPALHRRLREDGRAPASIDAPYQTGTNHRTLRTWRLAGAETVSAPYPLDPGLRNATAETLDRIVAPGASQVALDAVAGRFDGGTPTLQSWDQKLDEIARRDGDSAAAMLLSPTFNMFTNIDCNGSAAPTTCRLTRGLQARTLGGDRDWHG
jgi:hypothetical protein